MSPSRTRRAVVSIALGLIVTGLAAAPASAHGGRPDTNHRIFQATNDPAGNAIQVFDQEPDGSFVAGDLVATGGLGSGASLGSQGAVIRSGKLLLVVNAGDDTVSSLRITRDGVTLSDVESSGGVRPVSVTVNDDGIVYVLNAGDDTISGLRVDGRGDLRPIGDSTRALSTTGTGAAQVQFDQTGRSLVVTERTTNKIDVFRVGRDGRAAGPEVYDSVGTVPFGFDIDRRNHVVVSEAATGSVSSYQLGRGSLDVVSGAVPDTQAAACWLEISVDGRSAWTTNAASNTISAYAIARDGSLTLVAPVAATTPAGPTDIAQSRDGSHLFVRVRSGAVAVYAVGAGGSLTPLGEVVGAPSIGTSGLAAF
jgi:6-phosphogluconolactonase (cycloisomerase 2 family)